MEIKCIMHCNALPQFSPFLEQGAWTNVLSNYSVWHLKKNSVMLVHVQTTAALRAYIKKKEKKRKLSGCSNAVNMVTPMI